MKNAKLTAEQYREWLRLKKEVDIAETVSLTIRAMGDLIDFEQKHNL